MKKLNLSIPILALTLSTFAYAQSDSGSHGGNTKDINGTERLFDLVSEAKCFTTLTGKQMIAANPDYKNTIQKIAKVDWYLARKINREVEKMDFCFTGKLFRIDPQDADSAVLGDIAEFEKSGQAGVRIDDHVYIDRNIYKKMTFPGDRSMFMIHESLHSFFPDDMDQRKFFLRSMVNALAQVRGGSIRSDDELRILMTRYNMDFPYSSEINQYQSALKLLWSSKEVREKAILQTSNPGLLANFSMDEVNKNLDDTDKLTKEPLLEDIEDIFTNGTIDEFKTLLTKQSTTRVQIAQLVFEVYPQLSDEKCTLLWASPISNWANKIANQAFQYLNQTRVEIGKFRIFALPEIEALSATPVNNDKTLLISLEPRNSLNPSNPAFPESLGSFTHLIQSLTKRNDFDRVEALTTKNPDFSAAFGLVKVQSQIDSFNPSDSVLIQQKKLSANMLVEIRDGLIEDWIAQVIQGLSNEQQDQFRSMIENIKFKDKE